MKVRIVISLLLLALTFPMILCGCGGVTPPDPDATEPGGDDMLQAGENIINVYLIAGQSNAVGYGKDTGSVIANSDERFVEGFENVLYYGSQERWNGAYPNDIFKPVKLGMGVAADSSGAEIGIASAVADNGGMNAIIKCAQGATHLYPDSQYDVSLNYGTWTSPTYIKNNQVDLSKNPLIGHMYNRFVDTVTSGLQLLIEDGYTPVIKGVWWMQGEAEMFTLPMASAYRELFETLILDTRNMLSEATGYDCGNVPFICGLPKWNTKNGAAPAYQGMVRNAMTTVADELNNVGCVDCMPLNQHDSWHFDAAGQKYLGEHFVSALQAFEAENEVFQEKLSIDGELKLLINEKGIEFRANLTSYNSGKGYEYGFVIVPTAQLTENGIRGQYIEKLDQLDIEYQKIISQVVVEKMDEQYSDIYFIGKITGVSYADLNTAYTAIAYVKNAYGEYMYSSGHVSGSVAKLASEELYKDSENTEAIQKIVNAGINYLNNVPAENGEADTNLELLVDESIQMSYSEAGTTHQLAVSKSIEVDYFVKYTSDNPDVVSVDENGLLKAHGMGNAVITVECAGKSATVQITVSPASSNGVLLDGEISEGEYVGEVISASNANVSAEVVGMVKNGNLYIAFELIHGQWSPLANDWWRNDNVEFRLDGESYTVVFYEGVPTYSNNISQGMSKNEEIDGKLVTTIELCVEDVPEISQLMLCANGTNFGWLAIVHHNVCNTGYISEDGIIVGKPLELDNGLTLDGSFDESIYTENVKSNVISANGNGADVEILGTLTEQGVVFGVTIDHTKSPNATLIANGDWFTYMNVEFHFNSVGGETDQYMFFARNWQKVPGRAFSYCKTVQTDVGYTSTIEIFIPYETIGAGANAEAIPFTVRGWLETGWCDLLNNSWNATHTVTADGLSQITK